MSGHRLTKLEQKVIDLTVELWNEFIALPRVHPDETDEFRASLHDLQRIVMSRPTMRAMISEAERLDND